MWYRASMVVLAAAGSASLGAAQPVRVGEPIFVLTVVAPRLVREEAGRDRATGAPAELVSLTRRVSYDDLDLKLHADVLTLQQRVESTAKKACEQLASLFPLSDPRTPDCIAEAVAGAMEQAKAAMAAAGSTESRTGR
jgi:UrcA family protein